MEDDHSGHSVAEYREVEDLYPQEDYWAPEGYEHQANYNNYNNNRGQAYHHELNDNARRAFDDHISSVNYAQYYSPQYAMGPSVHYASNYLWAPTRPHEQSLYAGHQGRYLSQYPELWIPY